VNKSCDLHIRGGILMPMRQNDEWFRGDLLIRDGRIAEVVRGGGSELSANHSLDASGALVLPGFVQCHVHVVQSLLRHQAEGVALLEWLRDFTWPYEAALDGDGVEAAAELGIAELLCGGTTTAMDFGSCSHHDRVFEVAERLGIRLTSGKCHMDTGEGVPAGLIEESERSLAEAEALGTRWHGAANGRLRYAVAPRFALSCTRQLLEGCVRMARSNGWLLQTHANENRAEVEAVRRITGLSNIGFLHELGLTGDDVVLAHGVHLEAVELELLARTGTRICHCPGTNLKLGSGIADIPALQQAGVPVVLGADGAPCNNQLSVFHEMRLAATLHSLRHGPRCMEPASVLAMATREGARALHLDGEIGTLEDGKRADVVVIDLGGWSLLPDGEPANRIVYGANAQDVRHVLVDGKPLVVDGRLASGDERAIKKRVAAAWHDTRARMEESGWRTR
jgi:cytosine/adenosine deaminase-related metal-dependent hydrolase